MKSDKSRRAILNYWEKLPFDLYFYKCLFFFVFLSFLKPRFSAADLVDEVSPVVLGLTSDSVVAVQISAQRAVSALLRQLLVLGDAVAARDLAQSLCETYATSSRSVQRQS
jgi:hypothetical protein